MHYHQYAAIRLASLETELRHRTILYGLEIFESYCEDVRRRLKVRPLGMYGLEAKQHSKGAFKQVF